MKKKAIIKYKLYGETKEEQKEVIYQNNRITYFDDDIKTIVDLNRNTILRENKEYKYVIDFSKDFIIFHLNVDCVDLKIQIRIIEKKCNDEYLYIKYLLVDENITNEYEIKL